MGESMRSLAEPLSPLRTGLSPSVPPLPLPPPLETYPPPADQTNGDGAAGADARTRASGRLSWPGETLTPRPRRFHFRRFIRKEWASIVFWVLAVVSLAIVIDRLVEQKSRRDEWLRDNDMRLGLAILSEWILNVFPAAAKDHRAPGFLISNGMILLSIQNLCGSCPSFLCRICEWRMGRINKRGILSALVVHSVGAVALVKLLDWGLPKETLTSLMALQETRPAFCSCLRDFAMEVLVSSLFPVAFFVLPTLLRLNRTPTWVFVILLYPLYAVTTDSEGRGSCLSPTLTLVTCMWTQKGWWRIGAQSLGGIVSGRLMNTYFPDDPKV
jgi:hypothetical protein